MYLGQRNYSLQLLQALGVSSWHRIDTKNVFLTATPIFLESELPEQLFSIESMSFLSLKLAYLFTLRSFVILLMHTD